MYQNSVEKHTFACNNIFHEIATGIRSPHVIITVCFSILCMSCVISFISIYHSRNLLTWAFKSGLDLYVYIHLYIWQLFAFAIFQNIEHKKIILHEFKCFIFCSFFFPDFMLVWFGVSTSRALRALKRDPNRTLNRFFGAFLIQNLVQGIKFSLTYIQINIHPRTDVKLS